MYQNGLTSMMYCLHKTIILLFVSVGFSTACSFHKSRMANEALPVEKENIISAEGVGVLADNLGIMFLVTLRLKDILTFAAISKKCCELASKLRRPIKVEGETLDEKAMARIDQLHGLSLDLNNCQIVSPDKWIPRLLNSKELVRLNLDVNGKKTLHWAAKYGKVDLEGHIEVINLLLKKRAQVGARDNNGWTPLHLAAKNDHKEVVKLLLKQEAQVYARDNNGCTPLHLAAENGYTDVVKSLLKQEVQVYARDNNGCTPLHLAVENGYTGVVKLLLKKGAQIDKKDNDGWSPLHLAVYKGHIEVARLLLNNGANGEAKNKAGAKPLSKACLLDYFKFDKLFREHKENLEARYEHPKKTAINPATNKIRSYAESSTSFPLRSFCRGVYVKKNNHGASSLHSTDLNGYSESEKLILGEDVDVNTPPKVLSGKFFLNTIRKVERIFIWKRRKVEKGGESLHLAVEEGRLEIVGSLINKGIDIDEKDKKGNAPLHLAAKRGHLEIVELLIHRRAKVVKLLLLLEAEEGKNKKYGKKLISAANKEDIKARGTDKVFCQTIESYQIIMFLNIV
eukprot:gene308-397_t